VVSDIRRVVAGAAEPRIGHDIEIIVESGNTGDVDFGVVEQFFAAGHRAAMLVRNRDDSDCSSGQQIMVAGTLRRVVRSKGGAY